MRAVSTDLGRVLDGGQFDCHLVIDAFYGAERTLSDVPTDASWQLTWRKSADVPGSGQLMVQYASEQGESVTPREFTDRLAPFGQEVAPKIVIGAGDLQETVQVGRWGIDDVPSARDDQFRPVDQVVTVGSFVELTLLDPLEAVAASGFTRVERPQSTSAWAELQRLTGMKVLRSLPDATVPASLTYSLEQGGRLKAVQALAAAIGGTPYVQSDGTLTVLRDSSTTPVRRFEVGGSGTLLDFKYSMSKSGVYNEIVGIFETEDRQPIVVPPAQTIDGPLSIYGPFGKRTRYYSSPFVKTADAATSALQKILQQSQTATFRVPVEAVIDPRIEIGDCVELEQATEVFTGTVAEVVFRANKTMQMQVDVSRRVDEINLEL